MEFYYRNGRFCKEVDTHKKSISFIEEYDKLCRKCGGRGGGDQWKHTGWTCYKCGGDGIERKPFVTKIYTLDRLNSLNKAQETRDAKKFAKAQKELKEKKAAVKKMWLENMETLHKIVSLSSKQKKWYINKIKMIGSISENMIKAINISVQKNIIKQEKINQAEFVGSIGERLTKNLKIEKKSNFDTVFGTKYIYIFSDPDGNNYVWFTTTSLYTEQKLEDRVRLNFYDIGDNIEAKFTIKEHSTYNELKQNIIQRLKLV